MDKQSSPIVLTGIDNAAALNSATVRSMATEQILSVEFKDELRNDYPQGGSFPIRIRSCGLSVRPPPGGEVPLSQFARVTSIVAPMTINRQGQFPSVT
ncbi:MAG: efflux RND transporter permease subunit [Acetobacteraceae bacterium]|nr:efflux RND transporter permease subunit [Acetobacteraceae bacterium]